MTTSQEQRKSFDRSFEILQSVSEYGPLTVAELEKRVVLPRSTLYRLLQGLRRRELVFLDPTGMVRLGVGIIRLANNLHRQHPLPAVAKPALTELTEVTGETSLLTVVEWPYAVCINRVEPQQRMHISFDIGARRPLYAGATAKVLLAYSGAAQIADYLRVTRFEQFTDRTTTDPQEILGQLAEVREQGYCYTEAELDPGVAGLSVPLLGRDGLLIAGVSLVGPIGRLDVASGRAHVAAAADRIRQEVLDLSNP